MSIIAIITARGGSKRIPKKNIKEFYGKPMLAYAIDATKLETQLGWKADENFETGIKKTVEWYLKK